MSKQRGFENVQVKMYDHAAVVTFIVHTFQKDKGVPTEKKTRFYDVWIKRKEGWKAVASHGTALTD